MKQTRKREEICLDEDWGFSARNLPETEKADFDDGDWRRVRLPHDYSIEGEYDPVNPSGGSGGFLPTGTVWYRKRLSVSPAWTGRKVSLRFDGVFCNSTVYIDGEPVGGMPYGWLSFSCDITEQIRGKKTAVIAVKVDNSVQPAARWYTGTGIYSHVHLRVTDSVHIGENGVSILTPAEGNQAPDGRVLTETVLRNDSNREANAMLYTAIYRKKDGLRVAEAADHLKIPPRGEGILPQEMKVEDPLLWSMESPELYEVSSRLFAEEEPADDCITPFGFRTVAWDEENFYLNGESIKLRGVANHWALGALGAAQPKNIIRDKIQLMKDMGANCIRTAHNACPPEFYDLCDEMGMGVMDELFEGEKGKTCGDYGTRFFQTRWQTDVADWVKRDRNHPSVLIWSIGNETGSRNDNTGICRYIKNFDRSRPVTGSWIFTGVDIPGANGVSEQKSFERPAKELPLIATEAPHTHGVRGVYRTQTWFRGSNVAGGNRFEIPNLTEQEVFRYDWEPLSDPKRMWVSDYDNGVSQISVRKHWTLTRDLSWRLGEFRWTGFDYLGEANYVLGGWPYRMFHSGAVDCALFPKDMYYLYQSMWTEAPMLHILPSWTHPTLTEGTEIPVWVYSNCPWVELFCNGRSLGRLHRGAVSDRPWDKIQFDWLVPYEKGALTAVGYNEAGEKILEKTVKTAAEPAKITLTNTEGESLPATGSYAGQVTVTVSDNEGNFYPYGENRVHFRIFGAARLKAADNGCPTDTESHTAPHRKAFMGLCKAFVEPAGEAGDALLLAASVLGDKHLTVSDRISISVAQLPLRGTPKETSVELFCTTDGTEPTKESLPYRGPFSVCDGTCVRAAVFAKGNDVPLLLMEETFGKTEGICLDHTVSDPNRPAETPLFRVEASCRPQFCLSVGADRGLCGVFRDEQGALWKILTNVRGLLTLIHAETGLLLASDGEKVFLTDTETDRNAQWMRTGEMEHFDFLIHYRTERALAVTEEGEICLTAPDTYDPADRSDNLSYWRIQREK